jgi:hypothetical protein
MHRVKRIGVFSLAKMFEFLYGLLGLLFVPFFLVLAGLGAIAGKDSPAAGLATGVGAIVLAILFPIVYACMGFIAGLMGGLLYNFVAGRVGGIELELVAPATGQSLAAHV